MTVKIVPRVTRRPIMAAALVSALMVAPLASSWAGSLKDAIDFYKQGAFESAAPILERLADAGDPVASFWLGSMWHQGHGKPVNYRTAHSLYRLSAYHGNADAQNNLGLLYRDGRGVEKNLVVSYAWISLAASQGNGVAERNLARLGDRMTPDKIIEGQQLAAEYLEWISRPDRSARAQSGKKVSSASEAPNHATPTRARQGDEASSGPVVLASTGAADKDQGTPRTIQRDQFIVQLGLFRNPNGIAKLERTLRGKGIDFSKKAVTIRGTAYQQFRVGPFHQADMARKTSRRIDKILRINSAVIPVPS